MEYIIELIFDLKKVANITETKEFLRDLATELNCSMQYFIHEIDGHSRIIDNNICIHYINFNEEYFDNLISLIKIIKTKKFDILNYVNIDCIYEDGDSANIIYASPSYLKIIKTQGLKINKNIRLDKNRDKNKANNNEHDLILKALHKLTN